MQHKSIKEWAEQDRPREKLLEKGSASLSNSELIAILLGSGNSKMSAVELAREILNSYKNKLSLLGRCTADELKKFSGIGDAKAVTLLAALELGRRRKMETPNEKIKINSSLASFEILEPMMQDLLHEEFWMLLLDRGNHLLHKAKLSQGGTASTVMDVKLIAKMAIEKSAHALIISHNHPSGNLKPSQSDKDITHKISEAVSLFDIRLLDHLIIANNDYFSFSDEGLIKV